MASNGELSKNEFMKLHSDYVDELWCAISNEFSITTILIFGFDFTSQ